MTNEQLESCRSHLVVKSNYFIQKTRYTLSLQQQKIILYFISQIKPNDTDFQTYSFSLPELCDVCGIEHNGKNYRNFKDSIKKLHDSSFWIETEDSEYLISWVSDVRIDKEKSIVHLRFDSRLKPYLLQLREKFTAYELGSVLQMRSKYSIRIYELLRSYANIGVVRLDMAEFRQLLNLAGEYSDYRNLKKFVIDKAVAEINEYSDIYIVFSPIKTGKRVTGLIFSIAEKSSIDCCKLRILRESKLNGGKDNV